jgi:hypothetical protein
LTTSITTLVLCCESVKGQVTGSPPLPTPPLANYVKEGACIVLVMPAPATRLAYERPTLPLTPANKRRKLALWPV